MAVKPRARDVIMRSEKGGAPVGIIYLLKAKEWTSMEAVLQKTGFERTFVHNVLEEARENGWVKSRVDADGRTMERIGPFPGAKSLPNVLARRRPNRGMEGLTVTPDGKMLVGLMQSPLDNPDHVIRKTSRALRLVAFDPASGASRQYVYMIDTTRTAVSEIAAVTATTFIVVERDPLFQGDVKAPSTFKRIYKIDISQATDISDPADGAGGKMINGKTLEQLSDAELKAAGIVPVTKELAVDLLALPGGYPHDKAEGLAVINDTMIAVSNDDDFGIVPDGKGGITAKRLPGANDMVDNNRVYFIKLDKPLR